MLFRRRRRRCCWWLGGGQKGRSRAKTGSRRRHLGVFEAGVRHKYAADKCLFGVIETRKGILKFVYFFLAQKFRFRGFYFYLDFPKLDLLGFATHYLVGEVSGGKGEREGDTEK